MQQCLILACKVVSLQTYTCPCLGYVIEREGQDQAPSEELSATLRPTQSFERSVSRLTYHNDGRVSDERSQQCGIQISYVLKIVQ